MKKWLLLLLVFVCCVAAGLILFSDDDEAIQDSVVPTGNPSRIVSMAPNLTEILFALGLDKEIAGVTMFSDYPPAAAEKPKMGTFWQPNIEAVIAVKPDLVITLGFDQQEKLAKHLKQIGCNILTLNIEKISELFEAIREIGESTGTRQQANELVETTKKKIEALSTLVAIGQPPKVLWVVQREPLRVAGCDTFVNEIIELAGGKNAIGPTIHKYPPIGIEQVYACGVDVIMEPAMNENDLGSQKASSLKYWNKLESLPAVKNGRIYVIDGDKVSRLGPRLYEGVELIARCLRPELFVN